jgi:hypothetical protein
MDPESKLAAISGQSAKNAVHVATQIRLANTNCDVLLL